MDQIGGSDIFGDLNVDREAQHILKSIIKWAKVAAIVGLISAGLLLIMSLSSIIRYSGTQVLSFVTRVTLIFTIPVSIAILTLNIFLVRFATSTGGGLENTNQTAFNQGTGFLKMYFKTLGVIIIVIICLVVVAMIAFALGAAVA
jgi:hypothetical protein